MSVSLLRELEQTGASVPKPEPVGPVRLAIRNRRLIAVVALAAAFIAGGIAFLLPPSYLATTRLLPPQQNQSLASMFLGSQAAMPLAMMAQKDFGLKNPVDLYIGLLNSRSVQDGLIEQFQLSADYRLVRASELRYELARRTRIQVTKEGLIAVSVEDRDPQRAADLANGYGEQLRRITQRLAISEAGQRRQFFDLQVQQARDDVNQAESLFTVVQQRTGILEVDAQAKALIDTAASLRGEIASGEVRLRALRSFGTDRNPDVLQQQAQLSGWRRQLAELESKQSGDPAFSKGHAPVELKEYLRAMRELRYRESILEALLREAEIAKLDEAKEATVIQVVDVAVPPDGRSSPQRAAIVFFSTLSSVMTTICFLTARERFRCDSALRTRWQGLREEWRQ